MRRPCLNQDHVAGDQTCCVCAASWVRFTPEDHGLVTVGRVTQYLVEVNGKSVEVSNVQRAKIGMEGIV